MPDCTDLKSLIEQCIAEKEGNKEFILSFDDPGWSAEMGNPVSCVHLGESSGEYGSAQGWFGAPEEAVASLLANIQSRAKAA